MNTNYAWHFSDTLVQDYGQEPYLTFITKDRFQIPDLLDLVHSIETNCLDRHERAALATEVIKYKTCKGKALSTSLIKAIDFIEVIDYSRLKSDLRSCTAARARGIWLLLNTIPLPDDTEERPYIHERTGVIYRTNWLRRAKIFCNTNTFESSLDQFFEQEELPIKMQLQDTHKSLFIGRGLGITDFRLILPSVNINLEFKFLPKDGKVHNTHRAHYIIVFAEEDHKFHLTTPKTEFIQSLPITETLDLAKLMEDLTKYFKATGAEAKLFNI